MEKQGPENNLWVYGQVITDKGAKTIHGNGQSF